MSATADWEQVRALFHTALELPERQRAAFLAREAASPEVLREVASLLAAHPHAEGFLSTPPFRTNLVPETPRLDAHARLGHFEILGLIGRRS